MHVHNISHVAVFTPWVQGTTDFYRTFLNFVEVPRPDFGFGGAWLAPSSQSSALIHLYGEGPVRPPHWKENPPNIWKTGNVAHVSFDMTGYSDLWRALEESAIPWTESLITMGQIIQIFFYDPNGILLECSFSLSETQPDSTRKSSRQWQQPFITGGLLPFEPQAYERWMFDS